jgi:hypothetical protein
LTGCVAGATEVSVEAGFVGFADGAAALVVGAGVSFGARLAVSFLATVAVAAVWELGSRSGAGTSKPSSRPAPKAPKTIGHDANMLPLHKSLCPGEPERRRIGSGTDAGSRVRQSTL